MASNEAHDHRSDRPSEPVEDALGRLEERLDRASQAAERLLADAVERVSAGRGAGGSGPALGAGAGGSGTGSPAGPGGREAGAADDHAGKPPPAGWQQPGPERDAASPLLGDGDLLLGLFGAVRDRIPPDLQQRLAEAIREVLLALRALIDWYLERSERARSGPRRGPGHPNSVEAVRRGTGRAGAARLAPYNRAVPRSWILTGTPENQAAPLLSRTAAAVGARV